MTLDIGLKNFNANEKVRIVNSVFCQTDPNMQSLMKGS